MEIGVLMKTKYTQVSVDIDDASIPDNYFGYISVYFNNKTDEERFFYDTFSKNLLLKLQVFFTSVPNFTVDKEIRLEDGSILIDLPSTQSTIYATDVLRIVKEQEAKFLERTGL
jgi:hypothetical protein